MSHDVIEATNLGKRYQLGTIGTGSLSRDVTRWWAKVRGKEDPYSIVDEVENRRNSNPDFWALQDINFTIKQGETVGIIGKNGAGKSTLLKILSRITLPTKGEVKISGRIASLLEVGTGFHDELSGRENIFLNGTILGMTKKEIQRKLDEIIFFSGVEQHIDTPVKRYSSGMYVRLAFAVAAHLEPEILIVDEVLAVGDAEFQKKCLGKMNQVASEGRTILFVSHTMAAVKNLCNKGIVLKNGRVFFDGGIDQAIDKYLDIIAVNSRAEVQWTEIEKAPGDNNVRILGVRVIDKDFAACENILINEDFYVEIDFYNMKDGNFLHSNIQLFTQGGVGVFSSVNWPSASTNLDNYVQTGFKRGHYRSRVRIPGNYLNEGAYTVSALILQNTSIIRAYIQDVVSFNIIDSGVMRKEYSGEWLGVVRPRLEWQTTPVSY